VDFVFIAGKAVQRQGRFVDVDRLPRQVERAREALVERVGVASSQ